VKDDLPSNVLTTAAVLAAAMALSEP